MYTELGSAPLFIAMDRCYLIRELQTLVKWGFASVDAKARQLAASTHLVEVGSSFGGGGTLLSLGNPTAQPECCSLQRWC